MTKYTAHKIFHQNKIFSQQKMDIGWSASRNSIRYLFPISVKYAPNTFARTISMFIKIYSINIPGFCFKGESMF